jgi:TonB family protein
VAYIWVLPAVTAALATASPTPFAVASPMPSAIASPTSLEGVCPYMLLIEATDQMHYVVAFGAKTARIASFDLTLYSRNATYEASLPNVVMETPFTYAYGTPAFRSTAIVLENFGAEPLLGASVAFENTGSCPRQDDVIDPADSLTKPSRKVSAGRRDLERRLAGEKDNGASAPVAALPQPTPLVCPIPFSEKRVAHAFQPAYPVDALQAHATGVVRIRVLLDDSGAVTDAAVFRSSGNASLDAAARDAALNSTYAAGTFACHPHGGTYLFDADFAN